VEGSPRRPALRVGTTRPTSPRSSPRRSARATATAARPVKAARLPATKTLDDFDFTIASSVDRTLIAHLAQLDFPAEAKNIVFLGPPGTGKTDLSIALGVQARGAVSGTLVLVGASDGRWIAPLAGIVAAQLLSRFVSQRLVPDLTVTKHHDLGIRPHRGRAHLAGSRRDPSIERPSTLSRLPSSRR